MNQFSAVCRRGEHANGFRFRRARPVARFHLVRHDVIRTDADDIERAQRCRAPAAGVPRRLQDCHASMLVSAAFAFRVHVPPFGPRATVQDGRLYLAFFRTSCNRIAQFRPQSSEEKEKILCYQ